MWSAERLKASTASKGLKSLCKEMSLGGGDQRFWEGYPRAPPPV